MTTAEFNALCIDATEPEVLGPFWSAALGLDIGRHDDGDIELVGPTAGHTVWINRVPEPKTVKHRIHLDVHGLSVADLTDLGATVVDEQSFRWVVMLDPEGGEFCLFIRDRPPPYRLYEIVVNCADHDATSRWWGDLIGGRREVDDEGYSYLEEVPGMPFECIIFTPVAEPKRAKNRIHLDVNAESVDALVDAGATLLRPRDDTIDWDVLADPEGNEFCAFTPHRA